MSLFSGTTSPLGKRLKKVRRELSALDNDMKSLSGSSFRSGGLPRLSYRSPPAARSQPNPRAWRQLNDPRFLDHLTRTMQMTRPSLFDRRTQKGRAFVVLIFVSLVAWWLIYKFSDM